jgi:hypothetical protein
MKKTSRTAAIAIAVALTNAAATADGVLHFVELFSPTFSDGSIRRVRTDGTELQALVCTGDGARGHAVDSDEGVMYWSDVNADAIIRSDLAGFDPVAVISTGLEFPIAL